jgi:aminopeptidase N
LNTRFFVAHRFSYFVIMGSLVWLVIGMFLATSLRADEKFSITRSPGKLPKDIVPRAYVIQLEPDSDDLVTAGSESIDVEVLRSTDRIVINAVDTEISQARLSGPHTTEDLVPQIDPNAETVTFQTKTSLQPGSYQLSLAFRSKITEQPHGLFIQYFRAGNQLERLLSTQMEPTDARRLFPCWDEPVFRAVYQLTVRAKREDTVMSNMPIAGEQPLGADEKLVAFDRTPAMASYLFVLACGKLEWLEDEIAGVKVRILTTPGKKDLGRYALEVTKEILPYYNEYFGVPYPVPKLDQIALPAGFGGAMENWGGITYNEDLLLFDPQASSDLAKQRVFVTMAHEIAHQWFGDLVTMAWWDNIWLNEGFASWMEKKAADHFNPDWKVWVHANNDKQRAMAFDARKTSHPIQQPITDEAQANSAFDEITYQKGLSFIRMLENYLGEETFRSGIRFYMARHKYSNTTTEDLWEALETAAGKPVRDVAASWTEQPGFPLIKIKTQCANGRQTVSLEQTRFLIGESDTVPLRWSIPVGIMRVREPDKIEHILLDKLSAEFGFSGCDEAIEANAGDVGFFRVSYEPALFNKLKRSASQLPESDRVNLVTDTWATVESGDSPASTFFELLEGLGQDDSYAVWQSIIGFERTTGPLKLVNRLEQDQPGKTRYENYVCTLLNQKLAELTWDEKVGEPIEKRLLRPLLIEALGMFGDQPVIEEASRRFASFRENPTSLNPNLRPAVIRIVGRYSSPTDYDLLLRLAEESPTSEERRMYLHALSEVLDPELAQRSVEFFTSKHVAPGDGGRALEEEAWEHPEIVWTYATTHLKQMQQRFGFFRWNRLLANLAAGFIDRERAEELVRFAKQNLPAQGQREADNAANLIRFRSDLKKRALPKIDQWIATKIAQASAED